MKRKIFSVFIALVLVASFSWVTAVPVAAAPVTLEVVGDGNWGFTLAEMDQHFSTETIDASVEGGVTLSGSVTMGNFESSDSFNDVWYEIGLVSEATYLGYSWLHNKGVYMIAFWDEWDGGAYEYEYYKVHIQNVKGKDPDVSGNYLGDDEGYVDIWGIPDDAGSAWFKVPSATFDYELKYHDVTATNGKVDLRISIDNGATWSGWKLYKYAEDDMEAFYPGEAVAYGCADDDDLTNARIVSQIFVCSGTGEIFTATYDNIQVNDIPYELSPRVSNTNTGEGYTAIQLAIDDAETQAGHTISVAAGTYNEALEVNKALTLRGANADANPVTETRGAEAIIDAGGAKRAVNILSGLGVVTFEGFTVQNFAEQGICHRFDEQEGTTVHVLNNIVVAPPILVAHGNSIQVSGDGSTVIGNDVTGAQLESEEWAGTAILVVAADNVTVAGNFVHDAQIGIGVTGLEVPYGGPATRTLIELNTVQDSVYGISVQSDSRNTVIRYNDVLNNGLGEPDGSGIESMSWGETPSGTKIQFNNIVGNLPHGVVSYEWVDGIGPVIASEFSEEVDATKNWWGGVAGPQHSTNPYNTEATAAGSDNVTDNVDYLPWMIHTELASGWNIYSTPIAPDASSDTIDKALDLWGSSSGDKLIAYYYDSENQSWDEPTSLTPLQAVYIKMAAAATIDVVVSSEATPPPRTVMHVGWNLVGPAELGERLVDSALVDAYLGTGVAANLQGYSKALSPPLYQSNWTYLRDEVTTDKYFVPTEGYWVLMVNQGILGGVTTTPIYYEVP